MPDENCEVPSYKLTNWEEIGRLKEEASKLASSLLKDRLGGGGSISWEELKLISGNITLWKLLLKELRMRGLDIGNNRDQTVRLAERG